MGKRIKDDKGANVSILGIFVLLVILLCGALIVDYAKALYIKDLYTSFAQKSVQTALKQQDSIGGLKPESASKLVQEYMKQRDGNINTRDAQANKVTCDKSGKYPKIKITYDKTRRKDATGTTVTSTHGSTPHLTGPNKFFKNQYKVMQVEVTDITDANFLGIFGVGCSEIHIKASGIVSGSYDE